MHRHPRRLAFPVWIVVLMLDQMRADLLDPFRLDPGHRAGVDLGRLHLLGGHDPLRLGLEQEGTGVDKELRATGAGVFVLFLAQADVGQQAGQQRPVNFAVLAGRLIQLQLQFALDYLHDLAVDVMPLRQAHVGQEVIAAILAQLGLGQMFFLLLELLPEFQQRQKVGLFVLEPGMFLVRMGGLVHRPLAGVRYAQGRDDDRDLGQAMLVRPG